MKIFNTMTRKKEELTPLVPGNTAFMYAAPRCTTMCISAMRVRWWCSIRCAAIWSIRETGVLFVSNITDIDDKIIAKANEAGVSMPRVRGPL